MKNVIVPFLDLADTNSDLYWSLVESRCQTRGCWRGNCLTCLLQATITSEQLSLSSDHIAKHFSGGFGLMTILSLEDSTTINEEIEEQQSHILKASSLIMTHDHRFHFEIQKTNIKQEKDWKLDVYLLT